MGREGEISREAINFMSAEFARQHQSDCPDRDYDTNQLRIKLIVTTTLGLHLMLDLRDRLDRLIELAEEEQDANTRDSNRREDA